MNNAAVIVNYNDSERVVCLVKNLMKTNFFKYIVISDNNSKAEDIEKLKFLGPQVNCLENKKNLWFSGANNAALQWLKDKDIDFVFTINSDVFVDEKTLKATEELLVKNNKLSVVSAQMLEDGISKQNFYNFPSLTHCILENIGLVKLFKLKSKIREENPDYFICDYIRSSYWGVRYKDFLEIGFFDENTLLYHVETCVGLKLARNNKYFAVLKNYYYEHNHIYKKGYKIRGYKDSYKSLVYIFKNYFNKNRFQLFLLKVSYFIGLLIRKILFIS